MNHIYRIGALTFICSAMASRQHQSGVQDRLKQDISGLSASFGNNDGNQDCPAISIPISEVLLRIDTCLESVGRGLKDRELKLVREELEDCAQASLLAFIIAACANAEYMDRTIDCVFGKEDTIIKKLRLSEVEANAARKLFEQLWLPHKLPNGYEIVCSNSIDHHMKDRRHVDLISAMPREIALQILSNLKPKDLLKMAQTSRYWSELLEDDFLWKVKYREKKFRDPEPLQWAQRELFSWRIEFIRTFLLEHRWRILRHTPSVFLEGQFYGNFEFYSDDRVVLRRGFSTLVAYNVRSGEQLHEFEGHEFAILCVHVSGTVVASGSSDCTIRLWDLEARKCRHVLQGHTASVTCIFIHGFRLISGSADKSVRYWDVRSGKSLHIFGEHNSSVEFVSLHDKFAVSAGGDASIKVWDVGPTKALLHCFNNKWLAIKFLHFNGVQIISGYAQRAYIISLKCPNVQYSIPINGLSCVRLSGEHMATGYEGYARLWNLNTGIMECEFFEKKIFREIIAVDFNTFFVVTAYTGGYFYLWNRYEGTLVRRFDFRFPLVRRIIACDDKLLISASHPEQIIYTNVIVYHFDDTYDDYEDSAVRHQKKAKTY